MTWTGPDGWPASHPVALLRALETLPNADAFTSAELESFATLLASVAEGGADEELPRSRLASAPATNNELIGLHDLCLKLADHIDAMHQPAVSAISEQGTMVFDLVRLARETAEHARNAYGYVEAPARVVGRHPAIAAPNVTRMAAHVFERVTGRAATFTTDSMTFEVRGDWPKFLSSVFSSLYIGASASSQVKALAKNMPETK